MTIGETLHYYTLGNGVSKKVIGTVGSLLPRSSKANTSTVSASKETMSKAISSATPALWKYAGQHHNFIRLAGLSGAAAVILGAIGSHKLSLEEKGEAKKIFDTANRFHFFHSLALLAMPLTKYPVVSGCLMTSGIVLFCGTLYYRAFTNDRKYAKLAPIGGTCLILGWLSLML